MPHPISELARQSRRIKAELAILNSEFTTRNPSSDPEDIPPYSQWCANVSPEFTWDWRHLDYVRDFLAEVTLGNCLKLTISWPPQHSKTESVTVRYPLWRMLRKPGLRVGVCSYNQKFTNKQSRKTRRLVRRLGIEMGDVDAIDEWTLANGSTYVARGAGAGVAGEPFDLVIIDDPFKNRAEADSPTIQERVYEWYMDDVTPRVQKGGSIIVIQTRWCPGDLIGRIKESEDAGDWTHVVLKALAEADDPLGRAEGEPLCADRFTRENLENKRRIEGVGFESLYQQNPIPRGGTFFERQWFLEGGRPVDQDVHKLPRGLPMPGSATRLIRYWDLASSRHDSACYTAGVLMAKVGDGEHAMYYICDVVRGRWTPAERNDVLLQTAITDAQIPGFEKTWFESPVFDKNKAAARAIYSRLSGYPVSGDNVSGAGSKELRAEPVAGAAKGGIVKIIAGTWNAAYLTELEGFPRTTYRDQTDSTSGAFNRLCRGGFALASG